MKAHEKTHISAKPFSCKLCDKEFLFAQNLKQHEKNHANELPKETLSCHNCGDKFKKPKELKKHRRLVPQCVLKNKGTNLRVASLNICKGLYSKETLLLNLMINEDIDIIGISEADLSFFDEKRPFSLHGYKTFYPILRQDKNIKRLLVFVKQEIEVEERRDFMLPDISTVWLEYKPHQGKKIMICPKYREFNPLTGENDNDKKNIDAQLKRFEIFNNQVEMASKEGNLLIQGDLNIDLISWREESYYLKKWQKNTNPSLAEMD